MRRSPLLLTILTALSGCGDSYEDEGCMVVEEDAMSCPASSDVKLGDLFLPGQCGLDIVGVKGTGERKTLTAQTGMPEPACCYTVDVEDNEKGDCVVGRPYREDTVLRQAPIEVASLSPRASAWARAGGGEHASVAAFSRLALQLMAHGAPTELLAAAHQAALDEVRHTDICWEMARRFGAETIAPGRFPFGAPVNVICSLTELAIEATREGCVSETLAAHVAERAAELAPDPEVRAALKTIADDEARHAALSYRIVQWLVRTGGSEVRKAVRAAFAEPCPAIDVEEVALRAGVATSALAEAASQGADRVVRPAACALLAA